MKIQGKIAKWKNDKGFGFVTPDDGGQDIFIHKKSFLKRSREPEVGDIVTFEIVSTLAGKTWGINVLFQGQSDPKNIALIFDIFFIILSLLFLTEISYLTYTKILPLPIVAMYFCTSSFTIIIYRFDKLAAEFNDWRTRESFLHLLSLIGGWPGALIAQRIFHHKSKKNSFQIIFWMTVFFNIVFLALFHSTHH